MRSTIRPLVNAPQALLIAIFLNAAQFSTRSCVSAVVPPDAGAAYYRVSPLSLDFGDTIRIVPLDPYPSDLSPSEEFARGLLVKTKQRIVAESEPQSARRPANDYGESLGATWDTTSQHRTTPRVEDAIETIRMDLELLAPMMSNGRKFFRNDAPERGYDAIFQFPPGAAEITAARMVRELRLLRGEFAARLAGASISEPRTDEEGVDLTGTPIEMMPPPDETWKPQAFLAKIPVLGPGVVRGAFLSDADAIPLPTSAEAEATMAELERFPIWIYDDSRLWRERRRLTWTEIGRPLRLPGFVGLFPRSADDVDSPLELHRTTSGQEAIEAWETMTASDGIVMTLRGPLADLEEYFERERLLAKLSVHSFYHPPAFDWQQSFGGYILSVPSSRRADIIKRIRDALFSINLRRPERPDQVVREKPIDLSAIRREPKLPIWVAPVVRQDLDDATIEEMKEPFDVWRRRFGDQAGTSTRTLAHGD